MKKYTAKILATALYRASLGKEGKELEKIMNNFSSYLMDHRLVAMIPGILKELENLHFNTEGIVVANITSREELSPAEIKTIEDLVSKKTKKKVVVRQEEDKNILGGTIIKYEDKIIDLSIKNQLKNLAKQLSN
ncbi:MAG: ATP synthase F1 subunit delta [Candidatus Komeilibacteria bacterium RIFOXYC1_FULL_37_11]|uniref:ATP synthase subunit delta n=1 Tax=Candidatus Komeilibacteria bacterium RIFOXYC1_FULL_37_11 TaxID=1798555 RepID=A0A1G2BY33_9BACT|nr:MAG: ATP synthase F1 subunit delta [Candidatus Komeilibacteria bacterium RIFOXYC1_FULL_37_11]OGY95285.1 MAG: ATP synthase F1 subunit delta [Candidatus Komeilibacteria bacterium RIFOXYD1_FULL_37_29]